MCMMCEDEKSYAAYLAYLDAIQKSGKEVANANPDVESDRPRHQRRWKTPRASAGTAIRGPTTPPTTRPCPCTRRSSVRRVEKPADLTALTIAEARDGLAKGSRFSSVELTDAHVAAIEKARALNALCAQRDPGRRARGMAREADARERSGKRRAAERHPARHQGDLFATKGVRQPRPARRSSAISSRPTESTVTSQLWRDGAAACSASSQQ